MCTFCYTPYIGCPKGRRHYYLQWLKCKTAIKNGHSYCPIGESTEVKELQKLSGNILACPFHTHIAIQQIEFEFRQRDEVPSPIESSEPSSPTTSNTTCVDSENESEVEVNEVCQKSVCRPSSTAVYLDLRFPDPGPIKRHNSTSPRKTETNNDRSHPNSGKRRPVISPGLPASPAAYRHSRSRSQPQLQPHPKPTAKALKTEANSRDKGLKDVKKLSIPTVPSPPPEIITTLATPVDQTTKPFNTGLLTRRLGPSTALSISITKPPKMAIQKISSAKSEPDLNSKSKPKGSESSKSTANSITPHTFDSFLTPSGTLQSDSANTKTGSGSRLLTRLKEGAATTLYHHPALDLRRTLSTNTSNNSRRQAPATDPRTVTPWDQVLLPASVSKPLNLEVGKKDTSGRKPMDLAEAKGECSKTVHGCNQREVKNHFGLISGNENGRIEGQGQREGPRTAPLPAAMDMIMSRMESVGVGVGLGIGLAVTTCSADEIKLEAGRNHKRSVSATLPQERMGTGLDLRMRKECC